MLLALCFGALYLSLLVFCTRQGNWSLRVLVTIFGFITTILLATAVTGKAHLLLGSDPSFSRVLRHPRLAAAVILMLLALVVLAAYLGAQPKLR